MGMHLHVEQTPLRSRKQDIWRLIHLPLLGSVQLTFASLSPWERTSLPGLGGLRAQWQCRVPRAQVPVPPLPGKTFGKCGGKGRFLREVREPFLLCGLSGSGQEQVGKSMGVAGCGNEGPWKHGYPLPCLPQSLQPCLGSRLTLEETVVLA